MYPLVNIKRQYFRNFFIKSTYHCVFSLKRTYICFRHHTTAQNTKQKHCITG